MQRVTTDFEKRWHFNSAIALIMELTTKFIWPSRSKTAFAPKCARKCCKSLTLMLAPMTPHIAEEMWEMLGNKDGLWNAAVAGLD